MIILVTGGAGYIGSVMVESLLAAGHTPVIIDNLSRGHRASVPAGVPLHEGDVRDAGLLGRVFEEHQIEAILHFAASSLVGESMRVPEEYFTNNVGGVIALLRAAREHDVRRFIFSSSAATYGDPSSIPITEEAPTRPTNPYGESKLICERMLDWMGRCHGLRWIALRYFNAAGATASKGEDHAVETHLIPLALQVAAGRAESLPVFGTDYETPDGTCVRDYIHVADLAEAHLLALRALDTGFSGPYNLGNGRGFTVLEVIRSVERVTGKPLPWKAAERRPGDPPRLVASSARARADLGWNPRLAELDSMVESAWRWMRANPRGYDDRPGS